MPRRDSSIRLAAGLVLGCLGLFTLASAQEFWCEGLDDDGDGEIDEGCSRTCTDPYADGSPVLLDAQAVAATSVDLIRRGTGLAVAYADSRSGVSQVYARVTALSGAPDGGESQVGNGVDPAYAPALAWKGDLYGVTWVDERDGNPEVYFRLLGPDAVPVGLPLNVSTTLGDSLTPVVVWTGSEFGIAWDDVASGNRDVYFRRLDSLGAPLGPVQRVTTDPAIQEGVSLAWDGAQYGLAWSDERDGNREIYAIRLDSAGNPLGGGEVRVSNATGISEAASLVATAPGDFGIAWHDTRSGPAAIWYGRWAAPGYLPTEVPVSSGAAASTAPSLTTTGAELLVTWEDQRDGASEVYLRRIDPDGTPLSSDTRLTVGEGVSAPSALWHGSGLAVAYLGTLGGATPRPGLALAGCCAADHDADGWRSCDGDCNLTDAGQSPAAMETCDGRDTDCNGQVDEVCPGTCDAVDPTPAEEVFASPSGGDSPRIVWDGSGYGVAWRDVDSGDPVIYFRRLDAAGQPVGAAVRLTPAGLRGEDPALAWNGTEYAVVWRQWDPFVSAAANIALQRLDAAGAPIGASSEITRDPTPGSYGFDDPDIVWNGEEYVAAGHEWDNTSDPRAVVFFRLDEQGRPLDRPRDVSHPPEGAQPDLAFNGTGYGLVYTTFTRPFFRRLDRFGGVVTGEVLLSDDFGGKALPQVEATPWGYGTIWLDDGELFYRRLDTSGNPLALPANINEPPTQATRGISRLRWVGGEFLLATCKSLQRIVLARLDPDGARVAPDLRIDGDSGSAEKSSPDLAWNGQHPAVVWQDTRTLGPGSPRPLVSLQTCCEHAAPLPLVSGLAWTSGTSMSWADNGSGLYDRVRGDLVAVGSSGGLGQSVEDCDNDLTTNTNPEPFTPPLGGAAYYLVRSDGACGAGSYDSGGTAQQGPRDAGINSSVQACP